MKFAMVSLAVLLLVCAVSARPAGKSQAPAPPVPAPVPARKLRLPSIRNVNDNKNDNKNSILDQIINQLLNENVNIEEPVVTTEEPEEPCEPSTTEPPCEPSTTEPPCEPTTTVDPCDEDDGGWKSAGKAKSAGVRRKVASKVIPTAVEETPEVKAAKEEFFRVFQEAQARATAPKGRRITKA